MMEDKENGRGSSAHTHSDPGSGGSTRERSSVVWFLSLCMQFVVPVSPLARAAQGTVSSFTAMAKRCSSRDLVQGTNELLFPMPVHKVF